MSLDLSNLSDHEFYMLIEKESFRRGAVAVLVTADDIDYALNNNMAPGDSVSKLDEERRDLVRSLALDEVRSKLTMYSDVGMDSTFGNGDYYDFEYVLEEAGYVPFYN